MNNELKDNIDITIDNIKEISDNTSGREKIPQIIDYTKDVATAQSISTSIKKKLLNFQQDLNKSKQLSSDINTVIKEELINKITKMSKEVDSCCDELDTVLAKANREAYEILTNSKRSHDQALLISRNQSNML